MTAFALAMRLILADARVNPDAASEYKIASADLLSRHGAEIIRVARVESRFDFYAVGTRGEIGALQILPINARADQLCGDLVVTNPHQNAECAKRLIARAKRQCPRWWESRYNGRQCGPSRYAKRLRS